LSLNSFYCRASIVGLIAGSVVLLAQDTSATISGIVRDITGAGLAAANAELKLNEPPHTTFSLQTDNEGKFRFTALPLGTYTLKLTQPGFRRLTLEPIELAAAEQKILPPLRLDVGACGLPGSPDHFELLSPSDGTGNLSGSVTQEERQPLAGATVQWLCDPVAICLETRTDSTGEFTLSHLPPLRSITVRVTQPGFYVSKEEYEIQAGFASAYGPIILDQCLNADCDPRLRPIRTCE
jgi:hypothetical protein